MIIRHDRSDRDSLVDEEEWPALTSFFRGHGGASLIAPTWLLTAAHVALDIPTEVRLSVELAGKRYPIARTLLHPAYDREWLAGDEDDGNTTVDLALVELEAPVEDVLPFDLYDRSDEQGQEVLLLGRGEFGNGIRGARGTDRALRQVTNRIDDADDYWLKLRFDAPPDGTFQEKQLATASSVRLPANLLAWDSSRQTSILLPSRQASEKAPSTCISRTNANYFSPCCVKSHMLNSHPSVRLSPAMVTCTNV